ncbi:hypothetical protein FSP39_025094 [Pinctada imbricata]|uniref:Transcription factor TFIIIC triple barrel domain-containing protein n=1 Tax=Pinctada imbricata TaxID=66713 RepID=A0AA88YSU4_PINIB|nr:hypothetical protein FSP39_025094 [Pinctada imbricata]
MQKSSTSVENAKTFGIFMTYLNIMAKDSLILEELVVVAELTGILETDFLKTVKGDCSVLGIHTEKPMLQLDKYTFTGSYEDTLGTNLLFEEKPQENTPGKCIDSTDSTAEERKVLYYYRMVCIYEETIICLL